ncbi:MAG: ABC transporter ATP-binding protein [Planctomycetota bacterium]
MSGAPPCDARAVVECRGLSKVFKDFWLRPRVTAVDDLDLEVRRGEIFGLLGPNGSGKSTTIKMLLGLLFPTRGTALVLGRPAGHVATKGRIGYLPEESHLYPFLNARETLDFYGRLFSIDAPARRRRIDELIEQVGLGDAWRWPVGEYSKGMQRRIGLAQALINDPELLILDEPTSGLDPIGTREVKDLILDLQRRGRTVLLSSHLLGDVEEICSRVVVLYAGRIRAEGTCEELLTLTDSMQLTTDPLDGDTLGKVRELLAREGKTLRGAESPRQSLEALFLEIVRRARGAVGDGARGEAHDDHSTAAAPAAGRPPEKEEPASPPPKESSP